MNGHHKFKLATDIHSELRREEKLGAGKIDHSKIKVREPFDNIKEAIHYAWSISGARSNGGQGRVANEGEAAVP